MSTRKPLTDEEEQWIFDQWKQFGTSPFYIADNPIPLSMINRLKHADIILTVDRVNNTKRWKLNGDSWKVRRICHLDIM